MGITLLTQKNPITQNDQTNITDLVLLVKRRLCCWQQRWGSFRHIWDVYAALWLVLQFQTFAYFTVDFLNYTSKKIFVLAIFSIVQRIPFEEFCCLTVCAVTHLNSDSTRPNIVHLTSQYNILYIGLYSLKDNLPSLGIILTSGDRLTFKRICGICRVCLYDKSKMNINNSETICHLLPMKRCLQQHNMH